MDSNPDNHVEFSKEAAPKLAAGLVKIYAPNLEIVKKQLIELTKKQEMICRQLHDENLKLSETQCDPDLQEMFAKIKLYREKLAIIKTKMISLHDKSNKLKKRSFKLEQNKQNEAKQRAQQRDREEQLIGQLPT